MRRREPGITPPPSNVWGSMWTTDAAPAEAVRWIQEITDEESRRYGTLRYTRKWFAQDPDAATQWIAEADISEESRNQLLNNLPRSKRRARAKPAGSEK